MAIVDVFHQEHSDIITNNFKSFLENEVYIDLVFLCRNNKKVGAHQMVMGCLSKFLSQLLMENQSETKDKIIYVYVPDIRAKIMKHILQFIYTGKVMINKEELSEFNEDLLLLGMPLSVITSLDKTQPVNNDMTPINANNVTQTTSYIGNVENFVPQTNIAISSIESLNCGVLASSNSNTVISGMRYLNQPDQMIVMNHQNSTINQYATNFVPSVMPVISTVTTLGANQISMDSTHPRSAGPKLEEKLENKDITPNTRKRRKLIATSNTEKKLPKIDIRQCINLDDESDEDGDIITIS